MLQDTQTIRYYQRLSDAVEMWNRGYRNDELRLYRWLFSRSAT